MPMKLNLMRRALLRLSVFGSLAVSASLVSAQGVPIRMLVGFPAGGSTDLIARQLAVGLQNELGRPVVVENRPGAGGQIAAQAVKAARPDGATLFLSNAHTVSIIPVTMLAPGFDADKDFAPIGLVTINPDVFAVHAGTGATADASLKGFAAAAQAGQAKGNVGVPAPASAPEFAVSVIGKALGATVSAVPYRGDAPMVQDLVAGQVPAGIGGVGALLPYAEAGKIRIVAVNGTQRLARLPDVPTYAELGIPGLDEQMFTGLFGPAGMPEALVQQYNAALLKVIAAPAFAERLSNLGVEIRGSTPQELGQRARTGRAAYARLAQAAGHKPQ